MIPKRIQANYSLTRPSISPKSKNKRTIIQPSPHKFDGYNQEKSIDTNNYIIADHQNYICESFCTINTKLEPDP